MSQPDLSRCRSCGAPIWWRKNPSGKFQPMDYDLTTNQATDMPHHATCPERDRWRTPRPSSGRRGHG